MFLRSTNPPPSSRSLFNRVLDHRRLKTSHFEYNLSENSYSASFSLHPPPALTQSQSPPTMATPSIQSETLSSDLDQVVTEDDLLVLLGSISWSLEDCDSINLVNDCGQNLVHLSSQLGYHRLLIALIERGAHIHAKDVNGWSPQDFAQLHRDEDAIDILKGEWEDRVQDIISTGLLSIDLLRRFMPECVPTIQATKFLANPVSVLERESGSSRLIPSCLSLAPADWVLVNMRMVTSHPSGRL